MYTHVWSIFQSGQGPTADAEIRGMIQDLGGSAVQTLGDFSVDFLNNLKSLLAAGSEQSLDQDTINNVIDPAINIAKLRETTEATFQASRNVKIQL